MDKNLPEYHYFKAFLSNELDKIEEKEFNDLLKKDPEFLKKFNRFKRLQPFLSRAAQDRALEAEDALFDDIQSEVHEILIQTIPQSSWLKRLAENISLFIQNLNKFQKVALVVSSVAILIILFGGLFNDSQPCNKHTLFAEVFENSDILPFSRPLAQNQALYPLDEFRAESLYKNEEYLKAANSIIKNHDIELSPKYFKFLGLCFLKTTPSEPEKAKYYLSKIEESDLEYEEAIWLIALAYLKEGNYLDLAETLEKMIAEENPYVYQAMIVKGKIPCLSNTP